MYTCTWRSGRPDLAWHNLQIFGQTLVGNILSMLAHLGYSCYLTGIRWPPWLVEEAFKYCFQPGVYKTYPDHILPNAIAVAIEHANDLADRFDGDYREIKEDRSSSVAHERTRRNGAQAAFGVRSAAAETRLP